MGDLIKEIFTADLATLFVIAGILFLFIAVVGNITGKIEPGEKARIVSGILGVIFISGGLTIHFMQKEPPPSPNPFVVKPNTPPQPSKKTPPEPPPPKPDNMPPPKLQTQYPQVMAELTSFKQTGKFVTVVLTLRNTGDKQHYQWTCLSGRHLLGGKLLDVKQAKLVDLATGESWEPVNSGGSLWGWCDTLAPGQSLGAWITYEIPDPAKKIFSFSLPILNDYFYNLTLDQNPTSTPSSAN